MKKKTTKVRNKFERKILTQLEHTGIPVEYETEKIPYVIKSSYVPDYILRTTSGKIYIEAKGYFRPEAKRKMAAVKRQHPELDIRIIFCVSSPKRMAQYERWARKYNFIYAFGDVPDEWFIGN
jgi:predicted nuclease of restriction endonuclease-like RecB superfamily